MEREGPSLQKWDAKIGLNATIRLVRIGKRSPNELFRVVTIIYHRRLPSWLGWRHTKLLQYMEHDDIVQECVLKAWERFDWFDPDKGVFREWLRVVAHAHVIDLLRYFGADKRDAFVRPLFEDDPSPEETPLDHLLRKEPLELLKQSVNHSDLYRLRFDEGKTTREIASILGMSKSVVSDRLTRAVADVKKLLAA